MTPPVECTAQLFAPPIARLASQRALRSHEEVFRWLKDRRVVHLLIVLTFVLTWGVLDHYGFDLVVKTELKTVDDRIRYGRQAPVNPNIVFLAIDQATTSLSQLDATTIAASKPLTLMDGGFPFSREVYADVCDRLISAGAKAVAFDVLFLPPKPQDPIWRDTIDRYHDHVVIGMNFSDDQQDGFSTTLTLPTTDLFPNQDPTDDRLGYVNFWKDNYGGVVREAQYRQNLEWLNHRTPGADKLPKYYSLAARAVQKGGFASAVPNDLPARTMRFAGKPETVFPTYSLYKIFDPDIWPATFHNGEYFRNKIVLVGPQGDWTKDELLTPWGLMNGAEIHLNAMNDLLENDFLFPASKQTDFAIVISSALAALLLGLLIVPIAWRFLAAVGVVAGYTATVIWAFNGPGWILPVVAPSGLFVGATGVGFIYDFVLTQIEKLRLRATFERYNSKNVVKFLLQNTESYNEMLAGKRRPVTALFSDVRNFTTMAEKSDSGALVAKLNEYLTAMVDCLFRRDGTLDCFMGDGIMAVWGNTPYDFGPEEDAARAVRCGLDMIAELRRLNAKWLAEGGTEWKFGIGLNAGEVIVGDIGSPTTKRFATIGDPINLASRIEGLTKKYKVEILIGESVAALVKDKFYLKPMDLVQVKGKDLPVEVFTVLGEKTGELSPSDQKFLPLYEEAIRLFRQREFARAKEFFEQALQVQPGDHMSEEYLRSCVEYIKTPPDETWTGVRVMTSK